MARGATLAARWLHEPQPISNQTVGLGFPHPAGRYRPEGSGLTSPSCWSCRCMEGFLMRGWELILPRPVGLGFPHCAGRFRPGGSPFSSPGCRGCKGIEGFLIRGWKHILLGMRWIYLRSPSNQRPASGAGVSTPGGAVSTRGITVFVPRLSEL